MITGVSVGSPCTKTAPVSLNNSQTADELRSTLASAGMRRHTTCSLVPSKDSGRADVRLPTNMNVDSSACRKHVAQLTENEELEEPLTELITHVDYDQPNSSGGCTIS